MEKGKKSSSYDEEKLEAQAQVDIWNYVFGYVDMAVVKCSVEQGIPDLLEQHPQQQQGGGGSSGGSMTLPELSSALGCSSSALLYRIIRFLVHRRVFKEHFKSQGTSLGYSQTPLSRLLVKKNKETTMAPFVLLESSPVMIAAWHNLSARVLAAANKSIESSSPFEYAHGKHLWSYAATDPAHNKLRNDGMACDARVGVREAIDACPELLNGVNSMVDVGGGDGTALHVFVKAFPWVRGINFDLPHVVECCIVAPPDDDVGGRVELLFDSVPKADV